MKWRRAVVAARRRRPRARLEEQPRGGTVPLRSREVQGSPSGRVDGLDIGAGFQEHARYRGRGAGAEEVEAPVALSHGAAAAPIRPLHLEVDVGAGLYQHPGDLLVARGYSDHERGHQRPVWAGRQRVGPGATPEEEHQARDGGAHDGVDHGCSAGGIRLFEVLARVEEGV